MNKIVEFIRENKNRITTLAIQGDMISQRLVRLATMAISEGRDVAVWALLEETIKDWRDKFDE